MTQDPAAAAASFGRMTLGADMTLEHLAANVLAATTTSASDRAKQIFVQAWLVSVSIFLIPSIPD
jgi:regulatory factor X